MEREPDIDLGHDHLLFYVQWSPDRALNPQYADLPDIPRFCAIIEHMRPDGSGWCNSAINFDTPEIRRVTSKGNFWKVESWEPLTLSPSLLCTVEKGGCGDHGFIRGGLWVVA